MTDSPDSAEGQPLRCESVACALCGSRRSKPLVSARDGLTGAPGVFHVVRCADCGHLYENPRPAAEELARLYPADYAPYQQNVVTRHVRAAGLGRQWLRAIPGLRTAVRALLANRSTWVPAYVPQGRVLELGCSNGWFLEELRGQGWEAVGVEPIAGPAEVARRRGFQVHVGALVTAPFPLESFDAACAWMVVEHLPDPVATLGELRRVLKPGAWLAFSVPNAGCWERYAFGRYWYAWMLPVHFQHYTPRTVRRLLDQSGFELVRVIPQASLLNVVGSLGLAAQAWRPTAAIGRNLLHMTDDPPSWMNLLLAPAAHALAALGQAGRLTIIARKPS